MIRQEKFRISVTTENGQYPLMISHQEETFDLMYRGESISIINNGDNSWSLVIGQIDQATVNEIGQAIENYYRNQSVSYGKATI